MVFIRVNETYYNINSIYSIQFKILKNKLLDEQFYYIIINNEKHIIPFKKEYDRIVKDFKEIVGENNIYE
jgi:hypothetical protein